MQDDQHHSHLLEQTQKFIDALPWIPQEGPQELAYFSDADVLLYGGAAGGGKTSLAVGLCLTRHTQSLFIRREATQLGGVLDHVAHTHLLWSCITAILSANDSIFSFPPNMEDSLAVRSQGRITKATIMGTERVKAEGDNTTHSHQLCKQ